MSQNFPDEERARTYVRAYDSDATRLSRMSAADVRQEETEALRATGLVRLIGARASRDELTASILELRYPLIAEARAVMAEPEAPAFAMSDEDILKLVQEDGSSDYNEGVGERGGYVDWSVEGDTLTVKVQVFAGADADDPDELVTTVRKWRLVPVGEPARLTDGHMHPVGAHPGWLGHDGHPVHRHEMSTGRTEWYEMTS